MNLTLLIVLLSSILAGLTFWQDNERIFYDDLTGIIQKRDTPSQPVTVPSYPLTGEAELELLSGGNFDRSKNLS